MLRTLTEPLVIVVLFVLVRSADLAITAAVGRGVIRAICYGLVALLALIVMLRLLGIV